ncbi:YybH family protein [Sphingomonas echinoides]|uniref:SgcJ/EcaC family oxidoreductase n=1 Tax=Sphingomonas echinoides TaxID=59803 RepID=A0ABU4PKU6_9SPHN|nr:SgcJ/EcaC family oxidoreductase [Sphingomonas echinoides]MDX5984828.1 SgcJ/EcaC family oxidoreductase [Sphingomonas echinoides]
MMRFAFGLLLIATPLAVQARAPVPVTQPSPQAGVEAAMADSAAGWNAGDLARFMAVYSDDSDTSFVTKTGVLRGKAVMAERYRTKYDFANAAKRGALSFETLDFRLLDPAHALYIGRFTLRGGDGSVQSGMTSLVFRKERGGWRIIADHSS